jgi:hypothetical protein
LKLALLREAAILSHPPGPYPVLCMNEEHQREPEWLDTVNVPVEGWLDLIRDFSDPTIRGMLPFHCDLLNHEDKGIRTKA